MLVTHDKARTSWCAVNPQTQCAGRGCMAWRELADGRGWCGRAQVPLEALDAQVRTVARAIPFWMRLVNGGGLDL